MYVEDIKTTKNGKNYRTVLIRESYRDEEGRSRHRTLTNISDLPDAYIEQIKAIIKGATYVVPGLSQLEITASKEYGASYAALKVAQQTGLETILYSKPIEWRQYAMAMIIGRLLYQGSKLSLVSLYEDTALWELLGFDDSSRPDTRECYKALDRLLERQEVIQNKLAQKHLEDKCIVLYDLTSSYLEGEYENSELVSFGYNRDKKRGHEQINIGLLTNQEGCPIAVDVFPGNTPDQMTVRHQIERLAKEYHVSSVIFVGDRGMLTPKRIAEVNGEGFKTITALTHSQMENLFERGLISEDLFVSGKHNEVIDPQEPSVRYILRNNPVRRKESKNTRNELLAKTERELLRISSMKKERKDAAIAADVGGIWETYGTEKFFTWQVEKNRLSYSRKEEVIKAAQKLDGFYVIRTDVEEKTLSKEAVVKAYKKLSHVESAFRNFKSASLEIRPIYHHLDDRIQAHVFVCMLAYYVQWHMNQSLKPLLDRNKKDLPWTFQGILERLKSIRSQTCQLGGVVIPGMKCTPQRDQEEILRVLGVSVQEVVARKRK